MEQDRIVEILDRDADCLISFDEFSEAMISSYEKKDMEIVESAFSKLDSNRNGFLDYEELEQVLLHNE